MIKDPPKCHYLCGLYLLTVTILGIETKIFKCKQTQAHIPVAFRLMAPSSDGHVGSGKLCLAIVERMRLKRQIVLFYYKNSFTLQSPEGSKGRSVIVRQHLEDYCFRETKILFCRFIWLLAT